MLGMAQAPTYTRSTAFAEDERLNTGGRSTVRTDRLDAELDAAGASINALQVNQQLLQRDDGKLRDGIVTPQSISPTTALMFGASKFVPRGLWLVGTLYSVNDLIERNEATFVCLVLHTSGADFTVDRAAGKWQIFPGQPNAEDTVFTPTTDIASTTVQAAVEEVAAASKRANLPDYAFNYGAL